MSSSATWYASNAGELSGVTFGGYATYDSANPGRFRMSSGNLFRVYETWVESETDVTLSLRLNGDDGHSIFVDGLFVVGGGFNEAYQPDIDLVAGTPRRLQLTSNNAGGPWYVHCDARIGDVGDRVPLEDIPGVTIHAEGQFSGSDTGLLLHYTFDEDLGPIALDVSGHDHTGTVNSATWTDSGVDGGAYSFEGDTDYIEVADESDFDFDRTDQFSLCAWVKLAPKTWPMLGMML